MLNLSTIIEIDRCETRISFEEKYAGLVPEYNHKSFSLRNPYLKELSKTARNTPKHDNRVYFLLANFL